MQQLDNLYQKNEEIPEVDSIQSFESNRDTQSNMRLMTAGELP